MSTVEFLLFDIQYPAVRCANHLKFHMSCFKMRPPFSSRQEPPEAVGKRLFSLFSACFRGGATRSFPYLSCSPAPHRTGQAAFPHTALRFVIQ